MKETEIAFFTQEIDLEIKNKDAFSAWVIRTIRKEAKIPGEINFIFCNDNFLIDINRKYLNHDYYTDIITFDNSDFENEISGDIFISYERVIENAQKLSVYIDKEMSRVVIHGVLHLIGYNDNKIEEIAEMREKEDYYIAQKSFRIIN